METRLLDASDENQLRRFFDIARRAEQEDGRPWNAFWTYDEVAAMFRDPTEDQRSEGVCVYDGDQMVGTAFVGFSLLDNTDKAFVLPTVESELRGRGIGSTALEASVDLVRAEGRAEILSFSAYDFSERDTAATLRFAKRHGFSVANTEIYRILRLPVAAELLDRIIRESAPHHTAYSIETYVDAIPDRYLESYCHLVNQLVLDAPMGDLDYDEEKLTPEIQQEKTARNKRIGRVVYSTLAVKDGEAVAHSDLMLQPTGHQGHQWGTLVRRDHRGHRLGAAVKAANLTALQRGRPDITEVHTQNAETNANMVAINDLLGFEPVAVCPAFKRVL